jgi:PAS domain S-box-containing protein
MFTNEVDPGIVDHAAALQPADQATMAGNGRLAHDVWKKLTWPLFLACGFLIFVSASSIYLVISSQSSRELMNHALDVENKVWGILAVVRVAESEQRGYLLTDDPRYLETFDTATDASLRAIGALGEATRDNPAQLLALAEIEPLVASKFAELKETVRLHDAGDHAAALSLVQTDEGRELTARVRVALLHMMETQRQVIALRTSSSISANIWLLLVNLIGLALIIGLAAISVVAVRRMARRELRESESYAEKHLERMTAEMHDKTAALQRGVEERLHIFETTLDLILVVDRQGVLIRVNPSSVTILGYRPDEMIGRDVAEFIYPDDLEKTRDEMRAPRRLFEARYVHKEGRIVTLAWTGVWSEPEQQHLFIGRNITEERVAQLMFGLAVEACPSGMVMIDADGNMVMVNTEIEQQFGYRREELIGKPVEMLVPVRLRTQQVWPRGEFTPNPETRRMGAARDLFGLRKDGSEFPVEVGLNPIRTGERLLVLSVIVDISERKRTERLKDEFVSTVSHELRTPLTSISGSLGLLVGQWSGKLPESAARLLTIAHKNSQRLVRLVNDILDIEKTESGRVVFNFIRVDLRNAVKQEIEDNRGFAEGFGVAVRLDPASVEAEVSADPDRLAQVITNLLSNAIKFSPTGGEVLVCVEKGDNAFRVSVRDHGSGIPAEFKPHIFEKFAQADGTSSRQKGGTGLGLTIVKQIVERLGGKVGFDDAPGGGTKFYVELPAWESTVGREIDTESDASSPRVLFCEDDFAVAAVVRMRLRPAGFAVDFAHTIADTVALTAANRYAAILVDLRLRDGDGIGLVSRIRAQAHHTGTAIIVISGDLERGRSDVRSPGLNILDWLVKPIDFAKLIPILQAAIIPVPQQRPRILHIDDDIDVHSLVAYELHMADLLHADSMENAHRLLSTEKIDLVILDIAIGGDSGLDLLPDIHDSAGNSIPVIIFSTYGAGVRSDGQVHVALSKMDTSLESLGAAVRDQLALPPDPPLKEVA